MTERSDDTRQALLDAAEDLVMAYGFSGTSVDAIITRVGVTKGAFFHHFSSKADMGRALVERYADRDARHLLDTMERAERLATDPLQQILVFVALLEEEVANMQDPAPGCLFASFCYQAQLFDDVTLEVARRAMRRWREAVQDKLKRAAQRHPPRVDVDLETVADMLMVIFEGAFVMSRTMEDASVTAGQLGQYRTYLELLFAVR